MSDLKKQQFEPLFREFFKPLCGFAMKYVLDLEDSKNLVHDAFIALWERFDKLPTDTNYRSYLYTSVRNKCLNHLRDKKKVIDVNEVQAGISSEGSGGMEFKELEREIDLAINSLPEKCRIVFEMSRFNELKYAEIAEKLGISVKTVEGRMTQALSLLRESLRDFITLCILFYIFQGLIPYLVF